MTAGSRKHRWLHRMALGIALAALGGCDTRAVLAPEVESSSSAAKLLTAADSAGFIAWRKNTIGAADRPRLNVTYGRSAPVYYPAGAGQNVYATVAVTGVEASFCHEVSVSGPINWVLYEDVGSAIDCWQPTHSWVLGPVAYDAVDPSRSAFFFSIGNHMAITSRVDSAGKVWEVRFEDWEDDDFNDVVLSITFDVVPRKAYADPPAPFGDGGRLLR